MKRITTQIHELLWIASIALACVAGFAQHAHAQNHRSAAQHQSNAQESEGMVRIPAGTYTRFLKTDENATTVDLPAFYIDITAVTRGEYLEFVRANPQWSRSQIPRVFADENYLKDWAGDLDLGELSPESPVVWVSWFAASAYAQWKGKRLPTWEEWEYAASAPPIGETEKKLTSIILAWYSKPATHTLPHTRTTFQNTYGVWDMHGLIWEWVYDFNSILTGGDSRSEGALNQGLFCAAGSLNAEDKEDYASFMRFAFREGLRAAQTSKTLGFRCVKDT